MWYIIASILATFAIKKAIDENGEEIEIEDAFTDNSIVRFGPSVLLYWIFAQIQDSHKTPFQCSITPRSDKAKRLVQETGLQQ